MRKRRGERLGRLRTVTEQSARVARDMRPEAPPAPPPPPLVPTPWHALNPDTDEETLWRIAREEPPLRRWLVANTAASPELLEYVAQAGGPGVAEAFAVLFDGMEGRA